MRRFGIAVGAALLAVALAGCATPQGTTPAEIVSARCVRCHSLDLIKSVSKGTAGWESTIARMRRKGAQLSDDEARKVVEFLAGGGAAGL